MTTERIMVSAFERGLTLRDFEYMTVGMILDFIVTYNNLKLADEEDEGGIREATQSDFDNW